MKLTTIWTAHEYVPNEKIFKGINVECNGENLYVSVEAINELIYLLENQAQPLDYDYSYVDEVIE